MRITKYVKSDGENWILVKIRASKMCSYHKLDNIMHKNGWVRWNILRDRFNTLKKQIAKTDPVKFPNWKEVKIPMKAGTMNDIPAGIHKEAANT